MIYLDTSVLVPLFLQGVDSAHARTTVAELTRGEVVVSPWGILEFCSVVGRRVRGGGIGTAEGSAAIDGLDRLVQASFLILEPMPSDFDRARGWVSQFASGLRAADGLHLAIAARVEASMFTFDRGLQTAARRFGVALYR